MEYSYPIEKYYGNKRYQFRNITTDNGKKVIIRIDPMQINIREKEYYGKPSMSVDFNKLEDLKAISKVIREIEGDFCNVKALMVHGRIYFNKVVHDFNALHFRALSTCDCISKILVDPIKL